MRRIFKVVCLLVFILRLAAAQQPAALDAARLAKPFVGQWTGVLQYRDFQSDAMVRLPTWLEVTAAQGGGLHFTYTYDDGPAKTVVEQSTVMLNSTQSLYTVTSDRDHSSDTYQASGFEALSAKGLGTLLLTGKGIENEKPVDVRITLTIGRNIYIFRKETKPAGADFRLRDEYVFTRREPPAMPAAH